MNKKNKIYLKAESGGKLVDIDLDTIKKDIFKDIDWNSEWVYLFTIKFFIKDDIRRPLIRRIELPFVMETDDHEETIYQILDAVNHLSSNPIYAITKENFAENGEFTTDGNKEIYALRDEKGDIIKEFLIKF